MRTALRLREHESTVVDALSTRELAALDGSRANLTISSRRDGRYEVRAAEMVGSFSTETLQVTIAPKIAIRRLLYLLGYAARIPSAEQEILATSEDDLLDAMLELYAAALERALRTGLIHTYVPQYDSLAVPRGRIDSLSLTNKHFGLFPPVDCSFDDFTADNEVNQRLLAAALLLTRDSRRPPHLLSKLRSLIGRMDEVSQLNFSHGSPKPFVKDARFERYGAAISLSDLILRHCSLELRDGHTHALGMLVDMNVLYEDFAAEGLRQVLSKSTEVRLRKHPGGLYLANNGRVRIVPDLVWYCGGHRVCLVLDAKYKSSSEPLHEDIYQTVSYCQALGINRAALIYASVREQELKIVNGGPTIAVLRLDPDGEPAELKVRLEQLAQRLRNFFET